MSHRFTEKRQISANSCLSDLCLNSTASDVDRISGAVGFVGVTDSSRAESLCVSAEQENIRLIKTVPLQRFNGFLRPCLTIPPANVHTAEVILPYTYN